MYCTYGEEDKCIWYFSQIFNGRWYLEDSVILGRIILKWVINIVWGCWLDYSGSQYCPSADSCEHDNAALRMNRNFLQSKIKVTDKFFTPLLTILWVVSRMCCIAEDILPSLFSIIPARSILAQGCNLYRVSLIIRELCGNLCPCKITADILEQ
jgi:hypothetical protein